MATPGSGSTPPSSPLIAPTEEEWLAMSPAERERLLVTILDVLAERRNATVEGRQREPAEKWVFLGSAEQILRLKGMMADIEVRAEQAQAQAEQAMAGMRASILALLDARQIPVSAEIRERLESCQETATLQRWLIQATTATNLDEIFAE